MTKVKLREQSNTLGNLSAVAEERRANRSKASASGPNLAVEEAFGRACLARIQAFGFGEVAFFQGNLADALAWFRTALTTLEGDGLERWKLRVRVYLEGARVLIAPLTKEALGELGELTVGRGNLDRLGDRLRTLHPGYAELANAFSKLSLVRGEQASLIEIDPDNSALQISPTQRLQEGSAGSVALEEEPVPTKTARPLWRHGAISALISLIDTEVLLRCNQKDQCREEIRRRKQFDSNAFAQVEADLLEAQLFVIEENWTQAAKTLERDRNLDYRANLNQRAFWFA